MGKINVLGFDVANLIAAGEVVDRPASIVKELIENSIDSGAGTITVEIRNGGISHIRVSDNGCGIDPDDLPLAVLRHATSKIKNARDLETIATLGFRGEALAAIAAVTKLEIFSKPKENDSGTYMLCEGGEVIDLREAGCTDGTTVIANELFYNVPARRKFLKRDATEGAKITEIVEKIALAVPEISIKYIYDGQIRFITQGDGSLKNAIYSIFGKRTASCLVKVDRTENGVRTYGFVSDSSMNFSKRSEEIFYVNGRYIKSPLLMAALERAYISKIPSDKFPMCVLNIDLASAAVDVNVHPTKLEVKFSNERIVSEAVHYAVLTALNTSLLRPELEYGTVYGNVEEKNNEFFITDNKNKVNQIINAFVPVEKDKSNSQMQKSIPGSENINLPKKADDFFGKCSGQENSEHTKKITVNGTANVTANECSVMSSILAGYKIPDFSNAKNSNVNSNVNNETTLNINPEKSNIEKSHDNKNCLGENNDIPSGGKRAEETLNNIPEESEISASVPKYTIIGEAYNCYVIVELEDRILIIDKHAAHERILFDSLCERRKMKDKEAQLLVAPIEIHLLEDEFICLAEYAEDIRSVGFDFTADPHGKTVEITGIPAEINTGAAADMLKAMLSRLIEGIGTVESTENEFFEKALFKAACKAAIKGGRYYGIDHIKWICSKLLKAPEEDGKVIKTCPHGRPVAFEIKKSSIERQFSRIE